MRVLSLFAGAGGMDLGFEMAGFEADDMCCKSAHQSAAVRGVFVKLHLYAQASTHTNWV